MDEYGGVVEKKVQSFPSLLNRLSDSNSRLAPRQIDLQGRKIPERRESYSRALEPGAVFCHPKYSRALSEESLRRFEAHSPRNPCQHDPPPFESLGHHSLL